MISRRRMHRISVLSLAHSFAALLKSEFSALRGSFAAPSTPPTDDRGWNSPPSCDKRCLESEPPLNCGRFDVRMIFAPNQSDAYASAARDWRRRMYCASPPKALFACSMPFGKGQGISRASRCHRSCHTALCFSRSKLAPTASLRSGASAR
eukprot:scaffold368_cov258-Pinguiococcus_pyrenoidosus.AAC.28